MTDDNRDTVFKSIQEYNWQVEKIWSQGYMMVLSRGHTTLIGYPRSDKYRENGQVKKGLAERLGRRHR